MSEFKIEKDVPIPKIKRSGRKAKYPWAEMKVWDSFFVEGRTTDRFGGSISAAERRLGYKFSMRTVDGGVRIWRIE